MDVRCPVCGTVNRPNRLLSTHSFGSPDLDLRPAPDEGRLLEYRVETCASCGYAAGSLDEEVPAAAQAAMASPEWDGLLKRKDLPDLARTFLRAALICRHSLEPIGEIWNLLRAIWACDDAAPGAAQDLRRQAVARLKAALACGRAFMDQAGGNEALMADLCRRAGDWPEAMEWARTGLEVTDVPILVAVLNLEVRLIEARDGAVHQIREAMDGH
jgi:hypothetical protein